MKFSATGKAKDTPGLGKTSRGRTAELRPGSSPLDIPVRSELSVAVFGFSELEAMRTQMPAAEFETLFSRLGNVCAVAASEFGGKLVHLPSGQKMLVFGVPVLRELDSERAVLAAQRVLRAFESNGYSTDARLRCGVASGEGFVLHDEGPSLSPQDVSGAVFEEASKLEQGAPGNTLLVSCNVRSLFRSNFKLKKVLLSNGAGEAYEVSQSIASASRFWTGALESSLSAFTGRSEEMKVLHAAWAEAKNGQSSSILIEGEPGIGKSRLLHTFLEQAGTEQALVLNFFGSVHHRRTPFFPVAQGLYAFLGLKGLQSPSLIGSVIQNLLIDLDLDTAKHNANLRAILKCGGMDSHPPLQDATAEHPLETLLACFRRLSEIHPVALIFEDGHWMDDSTLELITYLCRSLENSNVLIAITRRPDKEEPGLNRPADRTLKMGRLNEAQTRALASRLRPDDMTDAHFDHIVMRSDGIPLFVEELMNIAHDRGSALFEERKETLIPASLRETLAARISHLGAGKELLLTAAAIGKQFCKELLAEVSGLISEQVSAHLAAFQKTGLIYPVGTAGEGLYEFKHGLVQDLAYQSIGPQVRGQYHQRIATVLTTHPERFPLIASEVIARHFELADDIVAALDYLEIAGVEAARLSAHKEAGKHFRNGLELAKRIESKTKRESTINRFLLLLGPQVMTKHGFASEQVHEVYTRARALSSEDGNSAEDLQMIWGLWGAYILKADIRFAKQLSDDFLRIAMMRQDPIEITAGHYMSGVGAFYVGALQEAEQCMLSAVKASLEADFNEMITRYSLDLGILARSYLSWCYALMDLPDKLHDNCLSLETAALLSDHAFCRAFSSCFQATAYNFLGNIREAEHHATTAAALSKEKGFAQQLAQAQINLGRVRAVVGDKTGIRLMEDGYKAYLATGAILARPYAEAWFAEARLQEGAAEAALNQLLPVRRFTIRSGESYFDAELLRLSALATGSARPQSGHLVRALLRKSAQHARRMGNKLHLGRTLTAQEV